MSIWPGRRPHIFSVSVAAFLGGSLRSSCSARRRVETAALLVDHVLPHRAVRQWVLSFAYPLRYVLVNPAAVDGQGIGHF